LLAPGVIDIHTDYLEKELNPRPDTNFPLELAFHMMDVRAIACGVTTVLGAARISSETDGTIGSWRGNGIRLVEAYEELQASALGRHYIHVRWEPNFEPCDEQLARLLELRPMIGNLVYNDATPGERQYMKSFEEQTKRWALMKGTTIEEARAWFEERVRLAKLHNNRPKVQAALGGVIPIGSHDDTKIEHVIEGHQFGATLAEMPVTMEAARQAKQLGMSVCMGAPNYYRGGSHCGNLSAREALAEGLVDMLCSDYHFPSLLGSAVLMMREGMAPHDALRLMTANPADHLGLHDLGRIEEGRLADLVAFEAEAAFAFVTNVWVDGHRKFSVNDDPARSLRPSHAAAVLGS
jgi:alpha-D-ribose 1-methylphosphonate 5-triphosphate diphosphatase